MERLIGFCLILLVNIYIAWRYMEEPIGPDEAHYAGWGLLDAKPYVDYIDVKPPGIHLWMRFLALITNKSLPAMKFLHHATIGLIMAYVYLITGSLGAALMGTALSQSAWLLAFQSWSDALSGALILLGFVAPPWVAVCAFGLALMMNYKIGPAGLIFMALNGWWIQIGAAAVLALLVVGLMVIFARPTIKAIWYGSVTVAGRFTKHREWSYFELVRWPPYHGIALMLVVPALVVLFHYGDLPVILAILSYLLLNGWGKVFRPCHWLPLSAVAAVLPPFEVGALFLLADLASTRFLTVQSVWWLTYNSLYSDVMSAKKVGEIIRREKPDVKKIWVNTYFPEIYVYADKFPHYGYDMLEIREEAHEWVAERNRKMRDDPPELVIEGPYAVFWQQRGYHLLLEVGNFRVYG